MKKKLKPSGSGWELYFSKTMLKLLGYDPLNTQILITTCNNILYLTPIKEKEEYKMIRKFQKSGNSYGIYFPLMLIKILNINPENDYIDITVNYNKLIVKGK